MLSIWTSLKFCCVCNGLNLFKTILNFNNPEVSRRHLKTLLEQGENDLGHLIIDLCD